MNTNSNRRDALSITQFMVLFWGALLSPLVESLLNITPQIQSKGGYLTPLLALPCLILWGYLLQCFAGKNRGYDQALGESFGKIGGKILLTGYFIWGILLMAIQLRLCATGFLAVGYQEGSLLFILPALSVFVWWMSGASLGGFGRTASLYFVILLLVFIAVLSLSWKEVEIIRVLPLWTEDVRPIVVGTVPVLGLFGYGIYASFFLGEVVSPTGLRRPWIAWSVAGCFFTSIFVFIATGTFGVTLLGDMEEGFFQLSKGVAVEGGFQRMESLVLALWTLADFILLGVLLRGTAQCGKKMINWTQSPLILSAIILLSTVIALIYPKIHLLAENFVLWGNVFFAWVLPAGLFLLKKCLHSKKNYGIMKQQ